MSPRRAFPYVVLLWGCGIIGMEHTTAAVVHSPWTQVSAQLVPQPMAREGTVLEVVGDHAYIYGGAGDENDAVFNDTWKFDFLNKRWSQLTATAVNPGRRYDHVSAVRGTDVYIFGGTKYAAKAVVEDFSFQLNDLWKLDTTQGTWVAVDKGGRTLTTPRPIPRSQATAVSTPQAMVVFGGVIIPNTMDIYPVDLGDVWKFDFDTLVWEEVAVASNSSVPTARFSHTATTVQLNGVVYMVVFSGRQNFDRRWTILNDAWMLPLMSGPELPSWTRLSATPPFGRILSAMVSTDSYLWLFGGFAFDTQATGRGVAFDGMLGAATSPLPTLTLIEDNLQFDNAGEQLDISALDGPSARFGHRMSVWNGNIVVYGGRFMQCLGDLWLRNASVLPRGANTDTTTAPRLIQVMSTMLTLSLVLLVLSACLLVVLVVIKRHRRRQSIVMDATASPSAGRRGLSVDEIAQFKLVPFHPSASTAPTDEICPICLVEFVADEQLRQLPCQHHFHAACIGEWLEHNLTCPMCKRDLSPAAYTAAPASAVAATTVASPQPPPTASSAAVVPLPGRIDMD
ncbi:hypothetical protein H310_04915 [Aphanomyces invadans]|uniref:RING-type domain-containing protein n=1 Tax=Aphanomyces invadans TaxID=157072 RepID=A0A024UC64_9STRA|nr:hypothetical protein H310_04915 [Aphanomyces invadans]ETW03457.1 hypothetical protein H310_04915 [Aphanomyces invadans]|eukprot:XP_008867686.1 hypothetical protein H310_04915 [Aphanomyces invadans]